MLSVAWGLPERYTAPVLRWLIILLLINGLVPDLREQVVLVVEEARSAYVLHSRAVATHDSASPEHACGPIDHHCTCCASQPIIAAGSGAVWPLPRARTESSTEYTGRARDGYFRRDLRPPVAA